MEIYECILKRRSIRKFLDKSINQKQIQKLLEAAMAAPSAINLQPWEFYVIIDKQKQIKIKNISPHYDYNSSLLIVVAGDKNRFITSAPAFWIEDCSAATENILLAATDMGLGSLWCGVYPKKDRMKEMVKILDLPKNIIPFSLIHIGYPDEQKRARTQYDLNKVRFI